MDRSISCKYGLLLSTFGQKRVRNIIFGVCFGVCFLSPDSAILRTSSEKLFQDDRFGADAAELYEK